MKIAIFTDAFFPQINGVVVYSVELVNYLASKGHEVVLVVPKCDDKDIKLKINPNVKIIKIPGIKMSFYPDFKFTNLLDVKLLSFFKERPDLINFQTPFTMGFKGIMLSKILRVPLAGTFHTFIGTEEYMKHLPKFSKKILSKKTAWRYIRRFYNPCNLIISPSIYTKKELIKNGIKPKIEVVNIGINFANYASKQSKINVKKNSFVFVGRIAHEKNIIKLLQAFDKLLKNKPNSYLYMIGDGPQFKEIKNVILSLGIKKNVFMLGRIDNNIIRKTNLLSKFKAFVTMSNTENQPVTLIEAMRKGLPLLCPKSRGIVEMVSGNGILTEPNNISGMADAMVKILSDKKLQLKYSKKSIENSKKYNSDVSLKKLEEVFNSLKKT